MCLIKSSLLMRINLPSTFHVPRTNKAFKNREKVQKIICRKKHKGSITPLPISQFFFLKKIHFQRKEQTLWPKAGPTERCYTEPGIQHHLSPAKHQVHGDVQIYSLLLASLFFLQTFKTEGFIAQVYLQITSSDPHSLAVREKWVTLHMPWNLLVGRQLSG